MPDISSVAESAVERVLGAIVILAIIGGTIALLFTNLGDVLAAFATPATGNTVLDAVIPILAIPLGFVVVFGLYKLVKDAFN